jgi:hypothetical protein
VWLPQQHPAVVAALQADLDAAAGKAAESSSEQAAGVHDAMQETGNSSSPINSPSAAQANDVSCSRDGSVKKQQQALQLLVPQFPGTPPTLLFRTGQQEQDAAQQQQQQQDGEVLPLRNVKMYVKYFGVANNSVKQVTALQE